MEKCSVSPQSPYTYCPIIYILNNLNICDTFNDRLSYLTFFVLPFQKQLGGICILVVVVVLPHGAKAKIITLSRLAYHKHHISGNSMHTYTMSETVPKLNTVMR